MKKITVSALKVGKCYLTNTGRVWRIINLLPDGRILYEHRPGHVPHMINKVWKWRTEHTLHLKLFSKSQRLFILALNT